MKQHLVGTLPSTITKDFTPRYNFKKTPTYKSSAHPVKEKQTPRYQ